MQLSGTVVYWHDDKGYGFVVCEQTTEKLFFHIRDNTQRNLRPQNGDRLQFSLQQDHKGRNIAAPWQFISANTNTNTNQIAATRSKLKLAGERDIAHTNYIALIFRIIVLVAVILGLLFGKLLYVLPLLYIEASLFTYWLYKADKDAAIARHGSRLTEESLQLFSLIGGWPGAYIAQQKLAHKRSKRSFRREFALVILGNSLLIICLLSPWGQQFLARMAIWA